MKRFKYELGVVTTLRKNIFPRGLNLAFNRQEKQDFLAYKILLDREGMRETDLVFLRWKNDNEKVTHLKSIKDKAMYSLGKLTPIDKDAENFVKGVHNEYYGVPLNYENSELDDGNCFNPEDFKDEKGWF